MAACSSHLQAASTHLSLRGKWNHAGSRQYFWQTTKELLQRHFANIFMSSILQSAMCIHVCTGYFISRKPATMNKGATIQRISFLFDCYTQISAFVTQVTSARSLRFFLTIRTLKTMMALASRSFSEGWCVWQGLNLRPRHYQRAPHFLSVRRVINRITNSAVWALLVGVPRFELGTSSLSVTRSNQLSYTPRRQKPLVFIGY